MMWYTHTIFAALLFLVLKGPLKFPWLAFPLVIVAALIPDIDHKNSKISNKHKITSRLVGLFFSHRGIIHSLIAAIAFFVLIFVACHNLGINPAFSYVFLVGYVSHLFLDSLNPHGVSWLAPFTKKKLRSKFKVKGLGEIVVLIASSALLVANVAKLLMF